MDKHQVSEKLLRADPNKMTINILIGLKLFIFT